MDSSTSVAPDAVPAARPIWQRLLSALPDLLIGLMFAVLVFDQFVYPGVNDWLVRRWPWWLDAMEAMGVVVLIEGALLWPQMTLVDIATRVQKRPPWWLIPPLVVGTVLMFGGGPLLRELLNPSSALFLPIAFSLWQRGQMLWQLPTQRPIDKMRARAIMGGRFNIALFVIAVPLVYELACSIYEAFQGRFDGSTLLQDRGVVYLLGMLMFLIAAFDHWRVGGTAFARRPRPIFWWDYIDVRRLDGGF